MTTKQIFDQFKIPPGLQKHMYTVAGIGKYICDHWQGPSINKDIVVKSLLIHDLGNLIKFDLSPGAKIYDPILEKPEWKEFQSKMKKKYGSSAHQATVQMTKEITDDQLIIKLINSMDSTNLESIFHASWEEKICEYADMRVTPNGITSMSERLDDIHERYKEHYADWADESQLATNKDFGNRIEQELQQNTSKDIIEITEEKIATYLVKLTDLEI